MSEGTDDPAPGDHWAHLGERARASRSPAELNEQCTRAQDAPKDSHDRRQVAANVKQDRLRQLEALIALVREDAGRLENDQRKLRGQVGEVVDAIAARLSRDAQGDAMADFVRRLAAAQVDDKQQVRVAQIREVVGDVADEVKRDDLAGDDQVIGLAIKAVNLCLMALVWHLDPDGTAARFATIAPDMLDELDSVGLLAASRDPVPVAFFVLGRMAQALDLARARKRASNIDGVDKLAIQHWHANTAQLKALHPGGDQLDDRDVRRVARKAREASKYRTQHGG